MSVSIFGVFAVTHRDDVMPAHECVDCGVLHLVT